MLPPQKDGEPGHLEGRGLGIAKRSDGGGKRETGGQHLNNALNASTSPPPIALNLQKTKVVYCKDDKRKQDYPEQKFDFLGYTFRPRRAKNRMGHLFISFIPAISNEAVKSIRSTIRQWHLTWRTDKSLEDLSHMFNPVIRGWINYYGSFYLNFAPK